METAQATDYGRSTRSGVDRGVGRMADSVGVIDEATTSVRTATSDVYQILNVLREYADRTIGPQPQPSNGGAKGPPDTPFRAESLRMSVGALHEAINELRGQVDRVLRI